jgi:hypothetical protein
MIKGYFLTFTSIISVCFALLSACTVDNMEIGDASNAEGGWTIEDGRFFAPGGSWSIKLPEQWLIMSSDSSVSTFQIVTANGTQIESQLVIGDEGYQVYDLEQEAKSWQQSAIDNIGEENVGDVDSFSNSSGNDGYQISYQATEGVSSRLIMLTNENDQLFFLNLDDVDDPYNDESNDLLRSFTFEE